MWVEQQLTKLYPNLPIVYNDNHLGMELDVYVPSLRLAFELNGIYHYEPIFGSERLARVQQRDSNKFQLCQQNNISLCVIDTSHQKYMKESTAAPFLDIIISIINQNFGE